MPFPPTPDHVWDITQPPDTQLANLLGQDIRNLKDDVMQRLSLLSGTTANRPTPETVNATWGGSGFGLLFFATDTGKLYQWNGTIWNDITALFFVPLPTGPADSAHVLRGDNTWVNTLTGGFTFGGDVSTSGGVIADHLNVTNGVGHQVTRSGETGVFVISGSNGFITLQIVAGPGVDVYIDGVRVGSITLGP